MAAPAELPSVTKRILSIAHLMLALVARFASSVRAPHRNMTQSRSRIAVLTGKLNNGRSPEDCLDVAQSHAAVAESLGHKALSGLAAELLALTEMNWNSNPVQALPIPIRAARQVGSVLKHVSYGEREQTDYPTM